MIILISRLDVKCIMTMNLDEIHNDYL